MEEKMKNRILTIAAVLCLGVSSLCLSQAKADTRAFRERDIWSTAIASGADLLDVPLTPAVRGVDNSNAKSCTYRFMVAVVSTSTVMYIRVSSADSYQNFSLNGGTALTAGVVYTFSFNASATFKYNFRVATTTTMGIFSLDRCVDTGAN